MLHAKQTRGKGVKAYGVKRFFWIQRRPPTVSQVIGNNYERPVPLKVRPETFRGTRLPSLIDGIQVLSF